MLKGVFGKHHGGVLRAILCLLVIMAAVGGAAIAGAQAQGTGASGARDEFLLTATVQNLKRLANLTARPPPRPMAA